MKRIFIIGILAALFLSSCSSRYLLVTLDSEEVRVIENRAFVSDQPPLTVSYDFWYPMGMPAILITNQSEDTLLLDWKASYFDFGKVKYYCFETEKVARRQQYPVLPPFLEPSQVLLPSKSIEFEGYPFRLKRRFRKQDLEGQTTFDQSYGTQVFHLVFSENNQQQQLEHRFWIRSVAALRTRGFRDLQKNNAAPCHQFFIDRRGDSFFTTEDWVYLSLDIIDFLIFVF